MTEFEINKKVALKLGYNYTCNDSQVFVNDVIFDPCNFITQAWGIMLKYNISIQFEACINPAAFLNMRHVGHNEFTFDKCGTHKKPLVAAMLVFLEI